MYPAYHYWEGIQNACGASQLAQWVKNPLEMQEVETDMSSVPGLGRSPGGEHGYQLHYSCLENSMNRGASWATVHGVEKSQTHLKRLSTHKGCFCLACLLPDYSPWLLGRGMRIGGIKVAPFRVCGGSHLSWFLSAMNLDTILAWSFLERLHFLHFFLLFSQSCPTLCDPIDCSTPDLPIHH